MPKDGHILLWILVAFVLGTLWEPVVELVEPVFTVDNQEVSNAD